MQRGFDPGVPADAIIDEPEKYVNPATALLLNEMRKIRTAIEEQSERKETPAPTQLKIQPAAVGHMRLRCYQWHLHPKIVGDYTLRVGLRDVSTISVTATATGGCIPEPLDLTIDRGQNISVVVGVGAAAVAASTDQVIDSFLMGYPE